MNCRARGSRRCRAASESGRWRGNSGDRRTMALVCAPRALVSALDEVPCQWTASNGRSGFRFSRTLLVTNDLTGRYLALTA
jgi:hypothetical protein